MENLPRWLFHRTDELRKLIIDNPGLPLVVCAGEDAYDHDSCPRSTICSRVTVQIAEVLYSGDWCESAERIFIDRDDFEQHIRDSESFQDDHDGLSDEEFDKAVEEELAKYDKDWVKAIVLEVNN